MLVQPAPAPAYNIPGLPQGGNLPAYTGTSIDQAVDAVVDTFAPMIPTVLPFVIGYVLLMWLVDYTLDHLPWGGASTSGSSVVWEDDDGAIVKHGDRYSRMRRT